MTDARPPFPEPTDDPDQLHIEHIHPHLEVDQSLIRTRIERVLTGEKAELLGLTIVLTDHDTVLELNREHLEHDYHTDVLAFPLGDDEQTLEGEIYIDLDTAQERHDEFNATFQEEVHRYLIHGLLHLLGYDDHTEAGQAAMRRQENKYLK